MVHLECIINVKYLKIRCNISFAAVSSDYEDFYLLEYKDNSLLKSNILSAKHFSFIPRVEERVKQKTDMK